MTAEVDYREVGRKACELEVARGRDGAFRCAAKAAAEALADHELEAHAFWSAVEQSLKPR